MPRIAPDDAASAVELTPALWERATFTNVFAGPLTWAGDPGPGDDRWRTRAKFAWAPDALYVLIESVGPAPASPFARHDDLLHQADAVEVFLDVAGDRRNIVEVQVSPKDVTADYYHRWSEAPSYPADRLDDDFYRAHHRADAGWDLKGLRVKSLVAPAADGQTRWTAMLVLPLAEPLTRVGLPAELHAGQTLRINVLRYAYEEQRGTRVLRHYSLVPVRHGRPHQSPMATVPLVAAP